MTSKLREYRQYRELTTSQAEQVAREYPHNTDPWLYEYEIDPSTGRVTDRYRLVNVVGTPVKIHR